MSAPEPGRRRRRTLRPEEHDLWRTVTKSVAPLRGRKPAVEEPIAPPPAPEAKSAAPPAAPRKPAHAKAHPQPKPAAPPTKPQLPSPAAIDRRTRQRLARGRRAIDARLDLHGFTQDEAHAALLVFLRRAQRDDARLVLVITGKGARTGDHMPYAERGVLRRLAPHWLALPAFRPYVVAFESAHVTHGGEGALYVQVRRP